MSAPSPHFAPIGPLTALGEYTALCFVPDAESGQPHVALGLAARFTVTKAQAAD